MSVIDTLITDRTAQDVDELYTLLSQGQNPSAGHKGAYNASDLNRVGEAVNYLKKKLCEIGIQSNPSEFEEIYDYQEFSGPLVSFESNVQAPADELTASINPVQIGSGTPSPTNVRAISGWTGAKVYATGKNLLYNGLQSTQNGKLTVNADKSLTINGSDNIGNVSSGYVGFTLGQLDYRKWLPNGTYHASIGTSASNASIQIATYDDSGASSIQLLTSAAESDFTVTESMKYVYVRVRVYNQTSAFTCYPKITMVSDASAPYEPFKGQTIDVTFPSTAGTVYGGTVDVVHGVLTVTHGQIASYTGETLPGVWISDRDVYAPGTSPSSGAQVVYELASPLTYQLTPHDLMTIAEYNIIWADTGDVYAQVLISVDLKIKDEAKAKTDWAKMDIPAISQTQKYIDRIWAIWVAVMAYRPDLELPEEMRFLDYIGANQIEELLKQTELAVTRIELSYRQYSGRHISGVNCLP